MRCGNVGIRSVDFHISTRRVRPGRATSRAWGRGAKPGGLLFALVVIRPDHAAQHAIRGVRRNLRDDRRRDQDTKRAHTPSRGSATRADPVTPRRASPRQTPTRSRHIANRIRLRRRAKRDHGDAPAAPGRQPLDPRAQRPTAPYCANTPTPPGPADCAARAGPAFVMWPRCRRSAELSSRGTSPIAALTWPALANRADVIDERPERQRDDRPDARHLCSRCTTGSAARHASAAAHRSPRSPSVSVVDHPPQRRQRLAPAPAAAPAAPAAPAPARAAPAAADSPSCRSSARITEIVPRPHLHQLPPAPQHLPQRPLRRRHAMRRAIPAAPIRLGQRRHVPPIGLHLAAARSPYIGA